jgi:hypothetical protein
VTTDLFQISQRINERLGTTGYPGGSVDAPESASWDCSFGNLKFLYGMSDQDPFLRETAPFRKERIDTATSPGEQSLDSGYWVRSQESWHYGGGLRNAEPLEISSDESRFRFADSGGIDVWTPGQLTLLHETDLLLSKASSFELLGTSYGVILFDSSGVILLNDSGTQLWSAATTGVYSITTDGDNYYAGTNNGTITTGPLASGGSTVEHDFVKPGKNVLVRWVKGRLIACVGNEVWEGAGSVWTQVDPGVSLPDSWVWSDVSEGPVAIYISGGSGTQSSIFKLEVTVVAGVVELSPLLLVAEMPRGEIVNTIYSYVGSFLCIGTSLGVRISSMEANGSLKIGPVTKSSTDGVHDFVADGSFLYAAVGNDSSAGAGVAKAGLVRLNLGQTLDNQPLLFAQANDLVSSGSGGRCTSVTTLNGKIWLGVDSEGVYKESNLFVATGWLESGRVRLGTAEDKTWRDFRILGKEGMTGTAIGYASRSVGDTSPATWQQVVAARGQYFDSTGKISSNPNAPTTSIWLALALVAPIGRVTSPNVVSYQLRAIPSPVRTRLIKVPLLMFDSETDKSGQVIGYDGYAFDRVQLLESLESTYSLVPFEDFTTGEKVNVYIEKVTFRRTAPPRHNEGNAGGLTTVLCRIV